MPDKISAFVEQVVHALMLGAVGVSIGVGQLMSSEAQLTRRLVVGRALSTGGLATAAGAILVWVPDLPLLGQIGVAAALSSLGTSGLELLFQRVLQGRP